ILKPHYYTAGINRSNTAVQAVLEQPCSTGGRTDTVRPKREPTGRTDLSDRSRLVLCNRSQELIGQACPTRRQVLQSDSACPTTGRTRLFKHRSNCRVRPVNASSNPKYLSRHPIPPQPPPLTGIPAMPRLPYNPLLSCAAYLHWKQLHDQEANDFVYTRATRIPFKWPKRWEPCTFRW
ncbi:hypothetical protein PCANC_11398, partial [Puccinia coronata f. sp. avenae]